MPLPTVRATIAAPEPLLKERSFLRIHNRAAKDALRKEGEHHHKERMPGHFKRSAHAKYGYKQRSPAYIRKKARRWRSTLDLVKTGRLRDEITKTPPVIRVGGKAADDEGNTGNLRLTLTMPFHVGAKAQESYARAAESGYRPTRNTTIVGRAGVTIRQMRRELAAITEDEGREIARGFLKRYGRNLAVALARSPRIRKRVAAARGSN
jgi:hypothetical protein